MLKDFYNPTTWRFTVDNMTGTFTAKTRHEAYLTLTRMLGHKRALEANLILLQDKTRI